MKKVKGWKNCDKDMTCNGYKFEVGKSYHQDGDIVLCENGFHFHESSLDIFKYYDRDSIVLEIEASGTVNTGDDKSVCSNIKIIKVLTEDEIKKICNLVTNTGLHNSGNWNSGDRNSGNWNSGNWNSGNWNSGNWNSGDSNSGDWNSGDSNSGDSNSGDRNSGNWNSGDWNKSDFNTGCFNTKPVDVILVFNKPVSKKQWDKAIKPSFLYFDLTLWISESDMTDREKKDHPEFYCQKGYLKTLEYKESWKRAWENKRDNDIELLEVLPNFDWDVFTEISGIHKPDDK